MSGTGIGGTVDTGKVIGMEEFDTGEFQFAVEGCMKHIYLPETHSRQTPKETPQHSIFLHNHPAYRERTTN